MDNLTGIEKFFIKSWEQWSGDQSLMQFCNNETKLELVKDFVDFDVFLFEINLEICEVVFYGEWDDIEEDYTISKAFDISGIILE